MKKINIDFISKSDEELMILINRNVQEAFEELYVRYSKKMVNFFYRMLNRDIEKAQDFLQDIFLKIIENPEKFDTNRKFSTWFFAIAVNMCNNDYQKAKTRNRFEEFEKENKHNYIDFINESIDINLFAKNLFDELEQMKIEHKAVFLLRYNDEKSIKEIAEITHCPEGTVKSRLFYIIKKLSERLAVFNPKYN